MEEGFEQVVVDLAKPEIAALASVASCSVGRRVSASKQTVMHE
jgi:hypothetical protein